MGSYFELIIYRRSLAALQITYKHFKCLALFLVEVTKSFFACVLFFFVHGDPVGSTDFSSFKTNRFF